MNYNYNTHRLHYLSILRAAVSHFVSFQRPFFVCLHNQGSLLEGESRLHHSFVVGPDWEGRTCAAWRLGVAFAGQGVSDSNSGTSGTRGGRGDADTLGGSTGAPSTKTEHARQEDGVGVGGEALFQEGSRLVLETQGPLSLGPCSTEDGRVAVEELARRMLQLEALVFKQDT